MKKKNTEDQKIAELIEATAKRESTSDTTYEQWVEFIRNVKWAPSGVGKDGIIKSGTGAIEVK